jgi:choline-glycine betaine transporter
MKFKEIIHQLLKDKDNNFSLREVITLIYVLLTIISWIGQQFFGSTIPEYMFYAFISMIGAGTFGYSLERGSKTPE